MDTVATFVERRSSARLRATPLRRRSGHVRTGHHQSPAVRLAPYLFERRKGTASRVDVVGTLELNLDRYPTKAAMSAFLQSLRYAAEATDSATWQPAYVDALELAGDVVRDSLAPIDAVATLHGYQAFMSRQERV